MSAHNYLPQRRLNLLPNSLPQKPSKNFLVRPHIADRLCHLLDEIELFLLVATHDEISSFWSAIANLRQCLQSQCPQKQSNVPQFLTGRRTQRDLCRILEVLADLPYPKLHLSSHLSEPPKSYQIKPQFAYPHLSTQR